jgi:hypothetical protein
MRPVAYLPGDPLKPGVDVGAHLSKGWGVAHLKGRFLIRATAGSDPEEPFRFSDPPSAVQRVLPLAGMN